MPQVFANNSISTLAVALADTDTTLFIQPGHGGRFPTVSGGDFCFCTLENAAGNLEIVKVTAHAAAAVSLTIERAQQGTTAQDWAPGDLFELRPTAAEAAAWEAARVELLAARQGQASMLANLQRFLNTFAPAAGNVDMGGHRLTGASDAVGALDYVTLQQLTAAVLTGSIPGQAGNARKLLGTDGLNAAFQTFLGSALNVSATGSLQTRQLYLVDSSGGPITLTLPALDANDWVWLVDIAGAAAANNITVGRNGANIRGVAEDLIIDVAFDSVLLVGGATSWVEL